MNHWAFKEGHKGQEVKRLQSSLGISADGDFGPQTRAALQQYQTDNGLQPDGISGPITQRSLGIEIYAGIDVSKWNNIDSWDKLNNSGLAEFCWIKLTEGNNYLCPKFAKHYKAAKKVGIPCGAYHFARPDLHTDPHKEIDNFVKNCPVSPGDLRPVLDFETAGDHDPDSIRGWVLTFLQEFENKSGIRPIIYTGGNMTKYYLKNDTTGIDDYALWHAYYPRGKKLDNGIKKDRLGGWKEWKIWQWTGSGTVPGCRGNIDRNWLVGGSRALEEIKIG